MMETLVQAQGPNDAARSSLIAPVSQAGLCISQETGISFVSCLIAAQLPTGSTYKLV